MKLNILKQENFLKTIFVVCVFLFSSSLLLPENLRNIPLFLLVLIILVACFQTTKIEPSNVLKKTVVINAVFFIITLSSIAYSTNLEYATKRIMVMLSLLVTPVSFYLICFKSKINLTDYKNKIYLIFFISSVLFFIGILVQNYFRGFLNENIFTHYPERINSRYGKYSMHPLYASMYVCISLLFALKIYNNLKVTYQKILLFIASAFLVLILILLARKGIIFFTLIVFAIYFFKHKSKRSIIVFIFSFCLLLMISIAIPPLRDRYIEFIDSLVNTNGLTKIGSTTIRLNIYKLSVSAISESVSFGYGVGDTKDVLTSYYETKPKVFNNEYYNTHNQFLSAWLSAGFLGFLALVTMMFHNIKSAIKSNDFVYISLISMFIFMLLIENILERQSGVLLFSFFINYFAFSSIQKSEC